MMKAPAYRQFEAADRAVLRAVEQIERTFADLLATTDPLAENVARQYVVERFLDVSLKRNPQMLDMFNGWGEHSVRLTNALMDWRDQREGR